MKSKSNERTISNGRTEYEGAADSKPLYYNDLADGGKSEGMCSPPRRFPLFLNKDTSLNLKMEDRTNGSIT